MKETKMAKRGNNEGSVYKRKRDGLWVAQVTIQRKHVSKYFKSQKEARIWLQETLSQIQNGMSLSAARATLKEFLEEWLETYKTSVRLKTIRQYTQIVRQHILPYLGEIKLKELRPDQIQALYNAKLSAGASPRTVILIHSVLHRSLSMALKWGLIGRNPTDAVTRPRKKRTEMSILTDSQVRAFLSAADQTRYGALFYLALNTGMRSGELFGLKWSDIDWSHRRLQVKRQLQHVPGYGLVFTEPKTASGRRMIVISQNTVEKLRKHRNQQDLDRIVTGDQWQENDLVFPTKVGTPMFPANMYKDFKNLLKKMGLPNIRFHDLRHTAATLMLQQGIHPKIVQERLGHADISMTLNTYSHVLPSMQEDAAEKLDELLRPIDVSDEFKKMGEGQAVYFAKRSPGRKNG
jgi:integrase